MTNPVSARPTIPDWYPDPRSEAPLRYWDGESWTTHVAPLDLSRQLAEAKTHRPWYKKKRVLAPVGVVAIVAIFAVLGQIPADSSTSSAPPSVVHSG